MSAQLNNSTQQPLDLSRSRHGTYSFSLSSPDDELEALDWLRSLLNLLLPPLFLLLLLLPELLEPELAPAPDEAPGWAAPLACGSPK